MSIHKSFSIPPQIDFIIKRIMNYGGEGYIVGGAIRDLILGRPVHDWDVATSFMPDEIEHLFSDKHTIPTGKKYGTISVIIDGMTVQVTTFRGEDQYTDYRHPDHIIFVRDIESDLIRRDFTINAIAFNPYRHPAIFDPMNGLMDIKRKLIRAVGNPSCRIKEDPLRMMRGARFLSQLGFDMETETGNAISEQASLILKVSPERVRDELDKLLLGDFAYKGISFMIDSGIFNFIFSSSAFNITNIGDFTQLKNIDNYPHDIILRLAAVFNFILIPGYVFDHNIIVKYIRDELNRLRYDKHTITHTSRVVSKIRNTAFSHEPSELAYQLKKLVNETSEEDARRIIFVKEQENLDQNIPLGIANIFDRILERKEPIHLSDLAITGHDLLNLGIGKANPAIIGKLLNLALEWVLKCPQKNHKSYLLPRLQSIIPDEERRE